MTIAGWPPAYFNHGALCGCLAREVPTQGIGQEGLDLLAQYYCDEISDAACSQFPVK
ncbi:hypothetical protein NKJ90_04875 [Mesorhizobium sp. M0051]|uniref:hypothetical protein n=1 Tax=unclassified Mesorhizobium TaxID=325217 RepID=UPI0003CF5316|nr:hypothetical protein [Mesorhizobium sp. LNHC252B00]ESY72279.1 hypothetical protein X743_17065 [Mesorhizobium sp. LNHC252B00]